jgi:tetratricopeptide (TPR) repeat protein
MMRLVTIIAFVLCLPAQSPDAIQQADRLFSYGEDPARDRHALELIERAMPSQANSYQLLWRASRAYYHVGDDAPSKEKLNYYERGIDAGRRAVALEPGRAEGHFWLGANYGGVGEQKGAFKALQLIRKIRAEMETVVRLNPGYEDGNGYLALCELDRQLPRLLGGNTTRSIAYCEQGLRVAPRNLELKLALAKGYLEAGRRDDARRQLQEILPQQINPERARAERGLQDEARRMLGAM